jgi:ABC-type multidrug transport system fused ATPase/permease subunit
MSPAATLDPGETPQGSMRSQLDLLIGDKRRLIVALSACSIVSGFTEAGILATIAQVAAARVGGSDKVHSHSGLFSVHASTTTLLWIAFALTVVRFVLQWPLSTLPARIAAEVQSGLRTKIFHAFTHASWDVQSRDREGQLQEIMTNQTSQATGGALQATGLITASITFVILMGSAVALSPAAAGVVFVIAVGMFAILRPLRSLGARRSRELSQAQVRYAGGIAEANRLAEDTQVFGVFDAQYERVAQLVRRCRDLFFRTQLISKLVPNVYQSLIYVLLVAALAALDAVGKGRAGSLGAVVLLLLRAAQNGQSIQASYQSLQQSLPFIDRLLKAERRYAESIPVDGERSLSSVRTIAFEDVSFEYNPGRPVLSDVSFRVDAGEAIGVIGPSGAGKSTMIQILLQLRPPADGRYLVNGEPVRELKREDWHRLVAYVPQEPRLLHASVAENIRFFRDISDEEVQRAARLARIHDDVIGWSDGYETLVGPRADAVSGGQQQRICLARALAARPQVLVLDEPTSALDPHSEKLIGESLVGLKHELTLFVIAHRMSTLDMCDRVMVILDGHLDAFDSKARLQEHNAYYRSASLIAAGSSGGALPDFEIPSPEAPSPEAPNGAATARIRRRAPSANGASALRLPDFFIVGHPKSGTTALYEMLRGHPQIFMPSGKEPWYFASELHERTPPRPEGMPQTLEQYAALFQDARPQQLVGEASALYLWSRTAARAIAEVQPDARIIAILREPASFLRSLHLQWLETYIETEADFQRALALEDERRAGRMLPEHTYWPQALLYSEHVRYVEQLRRYRERFGAEQMLVLIYDDFRAENEAVVRQVLRFLEIDDTLPIALSDANPSVRVRSQRLHHLVHAVSVGHGPLSLAVKGGLKVILPQDFRREALQSAQQRFLYSEPQAPDPELMAQLRARFREEVAALSEYLDRDLLELWGYDELA